MKNVTIHSAAILSINAADHWLGIGAADNSMSLFHRPQERPGGVSSSGSKMAGWQLYRTPQRTAAMVYYFFFLKLLSPSFPKRKKKTLILLIDIITNDFSARKPHLLLINIQITVLS